MGNYEGQAQEEMHHLLPPQLHQGDQRAVGDHAQASHAEAGALHADQDPAVLGDQMLGQMTKF